MLFARKYFVWCCKNKTGETRKRLKIIKSRGVYVAFYSYMRVETACRFVSNAPNVTKRNACFAFESEQV